MKGLQFAEDGEGSAVLQYREDRGLYITPTFIIILFLQAQRLGYVSIFMGSLISTDLHALQIGPKQTNGRRKEQDSFVLSFTTQPLTGIQGSSLFCGGLAWSSGDHL